MALDRCPDIAARWPRSRAEAASRSASRSIIVDSDIWLMELGETRR